MSENKSNIFSGFDIASTKQLALKGGRALFLRHLIGFSINFSGGIVLARLLGPEILGLYFISYTIFVILRQLIDFGIGVHLIRLPSEPTSQDIKAAYTLQQIIGLVGIVVIIMMIAPFASKLYGHKELFLLMSSAAAGAYFYSWQSIPISQLERNMEYHKVGLIEVTELFTFNFIAVVGAVAGVGILGLAFGNILRGFSSALLSVFLTGLRPTFLKDWNRIVALMKDTSPIIGSNLIVWFTMLAPPILVGSLSGPAELGIAQLAYTIVSYPMFIAAIIQRVSLPSLFKLQEDKESFNRAFQQTLQLLSVICIFFIMSIASISPWLIPFIYGKEWVEMDKVILVAAVPVTISALFSIYLSALYAKGHASIVFKQNIIHAILYWSVMAILASSYGAISVPISHLVAMPAGYLFIWGYAKYCGKINYKPLILSLMTGIAAMNLSWLMVKEWNSLIPVFLWVAFLFVLMFSPYFQGKQKVMMILNNYRRSN